MMVAERYEKALTQWVFGQGTKVPKPKLRVIVHSIADETGVGFDELFEYLAQKGTIYLSVLYYQKHPLR